VYLGAYRATTVSPWQTCAAGPDPPPGRITCTTLGNYIHNARLDYVVRDVTTNVTNTVSTHLINTRNGFGGGFFGDYTDITPDTNGTFHAFWTDSNNRQTVVWFYGFEFVPTPINQEDVVGAVPSGSGQTTIGTIALTALSGSPATSVTIGSSTGTGLSYSATLSGNTISVGMSADKGATVGNHQAALRVLSGSTEIAYAVIYTLIK